MFLTVCKRAVEDLNTAEIRCDIDLMVTREERVTNRHILRILEPHSSTIFIACCTFNKLYILASIEGALRNSTQD